MRTAGWPCWPAIRALTLKCLQIELLYDVEYDGWGCTAEAGPGETGLKN